MPCCWCTPTNPLKYPIIQKSWLLPTAAYAWVVPFNSPSAGDWRVLGFVCLITCSLMFVCLFALLLSLLLVTSITLNSPLQDSFMNQMPLHSTYSYSGIDKNTAVCLRPWNHAALYICSAFTLLLIYCCHLHFLQLILSREELQLSSVGFPVGFTEIQVLHASHSCNVAVPGAWVTCLHRFLMPLNCAKRFSSLPSVETSQQGQLVCWH